MFNKSLTLACLAAAVSALGLDNGNGSLNCKLETLIDDEKGTLTLCHYYEEIGQGSSSAPQFHGDLTWVSRKAMDVDVEYGFCMLGLVENDAGTATDRAAYDCFTSTTTIDAAKIAAERDSQMQYYLRDFKVTDGYSYASGATLRADLDNAQTGIIDDTPQYQDVMRQGDSTFTFQGINTKSFKDCTADATEDTKVNCAELKVNFRRDWATMQKDQDIQFSADQAENEVRMFAFMKTAPLGSDKLSMSEITGEIEFQPMSGYTARTLAQTTEDPKDVPTVEMKFCQDIINKNGAGVEVPMDIPCPPGFLDMGPSDDKMEPLPAAPDMITCTDPTKVFPDVEFPMDLGPCPEGWEIKQMSEEDMETAKYLQFLDDLTDLVCDGSDSDDDKAMWEDMAKDAMTKKDGGRRMQTMAELEAAKAAADAAAATTTTTTTTEDWKEAADATTNADFGFGTTGPTNSTSGDMDMDMDMADQICAEIQKFSADARRWNAGSSEEKQQIEYDWAKDVQDTIMMMFSDSASYITLGAVTVATAATFAF